MRSTFAIAALVGSALAAPQYGRVEEVKDVHYVVETVVATVYVTDDGTAQPTSTPQAVYQAPAVTTVVYEHHTKPKPTSVYVAPSYAASSYVAPSYPAAAPSPTPASSTPASAPAPTSTGYMDIVNTWRSKMGLKDLEHDDKLEANALECVTESNGQMIHKLNPGTYGQVLAPGTADDFEHVFVGGWLCEIPTLPGLDGVCSTESSGWAYEGQTGHAKILTDTSYSKIGCALYAGIWDCDLA